MCVCVCVCAPSSSSKIRERENIYSVECTYLLLSLFPTMIIRGDFNCVLTNTDWIGTMKFSKVLDKVVCSFDLVDVWETVSPRALYIRIIPRMVLQAVIENMSHQTLVVWKCGVKPVFTAFTDHLAECQRVNLEVPLLQRGWGLWKRNMEL
jgi:hypothetical protein